MPRLQHELALKPGTSVADVGAGSGELTVALAAEVGFSGQVFSTDIDTQALEQIRALVARRASERDGRAGPRTRHRLAAVATASPSTSLSRR